MPLSPLEVQEPSFQILNLNFKSEHDPNFWIEDFSNSHETTHDSRDIVGRGNVTSKNPRQSKSHMKPEVPA